MKRFLISLIIVSVFTGTMLIAQDAGSPNASQIGIDSAQQKLQEISVSKFEDAGLWYGVMAADEGIIQLRRFEGSPLDKEPLEGEVEAGIQEPDDNVLGCKGFLL